MTSAPQPASGRLATEQTNSSRAISVGNRTVAQGPQSIDGPLAGGFLMCDIS